MFLRGEFYQKFEIKPFWAMFSKQKLLKMTNDDSINHPLGHGHPFLSSTTPSGAEGPLPS